MNDEAASPREDHAPQKEDLVLLFELLIQYFQIFKMVDPDEFSEYLDICADGMEKHASPPNQVALVRYLASYSRGESPSPPWLSDVKALRAPKTSQ